MKRVEFTTRDGRQVSFSTHKKSRGKPTKARRSRTPRSRNLDASLNKWGYG